MEEFLDRFEIERATIPSIGPGRKQTLSSYGIETAADIKESEIAKVPGLWTCFALKTYRMERSRRSAVQVRS
jgi:DNA-binding helix-hairpin-helix protein with protein kinase domain